MLTLLAVATSIAFVVAAAAGFLSWARRRSIEPSGPIVPVGPAWVNRLLPANPAAAFVTAIVTAALLGVAFVSLGAVAIARQFPVYGWGSFVLTPFAIGFIAACLTTYRQKPTLWRFVLAGLLTALTAGLGFLALGAEGLVCLLMAAPITVPCSVTGALVAYFLCVQGRAQTAVLGMMVCLVPLGLLAEPGLLGAPPATTVRSAIDSQAPPSAVWAHLAEFDTITAPVDSWFFRAGVAYPISATLMDAPGSARCACATSPPDASSRPYGSGRKASD